MHLKCYQCISCGINPVFTGLSPTYGQVTYALLTRAPVSAPKGLSLDLHVLGLSLAFILSQDQTLRCIFFIINPPRRVNCQIDESRQSSFDGKAFLLYLSCTTSFLVWSHSFKDRCASRNRGIITAVSLLAGAKIEELFLPTKFFLLYFYIFIKYAQKGVQKGSFWHFYLARI